jgi:hypothetical protein
MTTPIALAPAYSWKKTLWKGLRPALIVAVTAFFLALDQHVDSKWLVELGIPPALAVFVLEAVRNWVKTRDLRSEK